MRTNKNKDMPEDLHLNVDQSGLDEDKVEQEDFIPRACCPIIRTHHRFLLRELECTQQYAPIYRCRLEQLEERVLRSMREVLRGVRPPVFPSQMFSDTPLCEESSSRSSTVKAAPDETFHICKEENNHNEEKEGEEQKKGFSPLREDTRAVVVSPSEKEGWREASVSSPCRIIDLPVGMPAVVVGVTYKQMKQLPQFLKDYQKELLRLDTGDGSGEDNDADDAELALPLEENDVGGGENKGVREGGDADDDEECARNLCSASDEVYLEDSSGRMLLQHVEVGQLCTGLVLAVYGRLTPEGGFFVETLSPSQLHDLYLSPRRRCPSSAVLCGTPSHPTTTHKPNYIGFLSGLSLDASPDPSTALRMHLLVNFIRGEVGSAAAREKASRISRLIIGGNHLLSTEEMKLKKKVKLEPLDHVRLKLNQRETSFTSSSVMTKHLDAVLTSLCETVDVEVMPGDRDMSNAFFPQQPIHPVLLPTASRYSTLRLVTNPFEFTAFPSSDSVEGGEDARDRGQKEEGVEAGIKNTNSTTRTTTGIISSSSSTSSSSGQNRMGNAVIPEVDGGVHFFVSAGQNVNDIARQTEYTSRLDVLALMIHSGCACPTAPNTLWSYPFSKEDPFLFPRCPHVLVACEQPRFETGWMRISTRSENTSMRRNEIGEECEVIEEVKEENEEGKANRMNKSRRGADEVEQKGEEGVRLVCVPPFRQHGMLVLVDVNSPTWETSTIDFTFLED